MKKSIYVLGTLLSALMVLFSACEDDAVNASREAIVPEISIEGNSVIVWERGEQFVEPGYTASFAGQDYTSRVEVKGFLNVNKTGSYPLKYIIKTDDGLFAFANRLVIIPNNAPSPLASGAYGIDGTKSHRINAAGTVTTYGGNFSIYLYQTANDGEFYVSDFLGGYYDQRAGYGSSYAASGTMKVDQDGNFTLIDSKVPGWQDGLTGLSGSISETGEISWSAIYAGMTFNVVLK
ncbi:MAG TPA: hypothetical protein DEF88_03810 [Porphyromonadaceae bacterium]|jgi:hypothetical protein|nr:hypothetical protein [Porphyromonadaceae bacterium]HBX19558.1 hypothetical protein [Porphyromonadaceae bacterium]HCM22292.1 hypothetical protein [Porphyromonadaceae bacterium]